MKISLEPIPTDQMVSVKQPSQESVAGASSRPHMGGNSVVPKDTGQLDRAYPWLLGASTCLCALLCWMYVTKPVIIQESATYPVAPVDKPLKAQEEPAKLAASATPRVAELIPSDSLPSSTNKSATDHNVGSAKGVTSRPGQIQPKVAKQGVATGWEKTNLKVQHILSADSGSGEHEKIVINVPVLYETRSMRWTPRKVQKARDVLGRLMLYEQNLSNLRKDGAAILADWNQIIKETIPVDSLRADSPSLPYNHGQSGEPPVLPGSSSVIQVEDK